MTQAQMLDSTRRQPSLLWLGWTLQACGALAVLAVLAAVVLLLSARQPVWAAALLALLAGTVLIYTSARFEAWRYVLPGVFAVAVFIVLPMVYTVAISFSNYSSEHLLSLQRSTAVLLSRKESTEQGLDFTVHARAGQIRLRLRDDDGRALESAWLTLSSQPQRVELQVVEAPAGSDGAALGLRELVALSDGLAALILVTPEGLSYSQTSLHRFNQSQPSFESLPDGRLRRTRDGVEWQANTSSGFWESADGQRLHPGFRAMVGWDNYRRMFTEERFLQPFLRVLGWTVSFATLNTALTFALGLFFAVALNWNALRGRAYYRLLLFLPYAVPAFISIPVFRGLFNENLGEINLILEQLFQIRPGWFSEATLARSMVLIVNTWLGYPYMMILAMGLIKAIPEELYEASALAGAGPLTNFFRITLPLIVRPIAPLLVASFAVNFNNLTLIALLTEGAPDYLDTQVPVGATDLLASYTYRIAFDDGGQNYALACAISTIVFLIVATLAIVNLRLFRQGAVER
jgi:maltose/maltodextrin transport system permease protein